MDTYPPNGVRPLPPKVDGFEPWMLVLSPNGVAGPDMTWMDCCAKGLEQWGTITDRALVTTKYEQIHNVYPDLLARAPKGLRLLGGFAPSRLPGFSSSDFPASFDLYDAEAWRDIASATCAVAWMTNVDVVTLEMERALTPFHTGQQAINLTKLVKALEPLARINVTIRWNCVIILEDTEAFPDRHDQTAELVQAVAETVPRSQFFVAYGWRPDSHNNADRLRYWREMGHMVGLGALVPRYLVTASGMLDGKPCYKPETIHSAMERTPYGRPSVWPGAKAWAETASVWARMQRGKIEADLSPV